MRTIRLVTLAAGMLMPALLGALSFAAGLGPAGWVIGVASGYGAIALMVRGRLRSGDRRILPADWVTATRALLAAAAAGLVADSFDRALPVTALIILAAVALALDAVDGPVARRTRTATPLGARFDGEVDAFLILVLSVAVSREYGGWVLAIGAARYAFLLAGKPVRWLAAPLPPRYWRKVVAAVQGVVLTVAVSALLPRWVGMLAVAVALLLLAESFGRDVVWLYRTGAGVRTRRVVRCGAAAVSAAIVWAALVAPDRLDRLTPAAFARIPVEGVVLVAIGMWLPRRARRVFAGVAGLLVGLLTVVKVADIAFYQELGRPFDPVLDWGNLAPAVGVVRDSIGEAATIALVVVAGLVIVGLIAAITVATVHVSSVTSRHRPRSARGVGVLGVAWALSAALSLQTGPGDPFASTSTAGLAVAQVRAAEAAVQDQGRFNAAIHAVDPYAFVRASNLLTGLRGKDVLVVFVESYGQVAVQGTSFSTGVDAVLRDGTSALSAAGYSARSAWLDSPTFGGISWLAHSTLQSGLWVANQQRYDQLVSSKRFTLSAAFAKAGWRTVSDIPSDDEPWPQGTSFYHYAQLYDRRNVGYHGPTFSYASMPDQYSLAAFQRHELRPGHRPVMAEIDLVSSHTPWTPLPTMIPWSEVGDGSVFDPMPARGLTPDEAWTSTSTVQRLYGQSVQYSVQALVSWIVQLHDDNLVVVMLGDHQPATTVSGVGANHHVPISFITSDAQLLNRIASWQWQDGLLPSSGAPLWPMDAFRNRFFDAFNPSASSAAR